MKVITVTVQKGGVGKTTTAAALAQAAVYRGRRALAIDLEPQGNLGFALGANPAAETGTAYNLIMGAPAAECIQTTAQGIDFIAADIDLATITSGTGSARRLRRALEPIRDSYDLIIIDTVPTPGELMYNALMAADGLVIPLEADAYNLQSLYQMTNTARQIQAANDDLQILGLVLTKHDNRTTFGRQLREMATKQAAEQGIPFLGAIRNTIKVKEAAGLQKSLFSYAPARPAAIDYLEIYSKVTHDAQEV